MTRQRIIHDIESLYPPDSHEEGRELLLQAICQNWYELPEEILVRLRELCIEKDDRQARKAGLRP